jgi:citrate lyase subunit beta / citryl-CoA lyase
MLARMENRPRIVRSLVFSVAHDEDKIMQLADMGMDAICLDMEDLTPSPYKEDARRVVPAVAAKLAARGIIVFARTNGMADGMAGADLDAILSTDMHCVSLPKATRADEVIEYAELVAAAEARKGLPLGYTLVRPVVETAMGVKNAYEIAAASPRVAYMGGVSGGMWGDLGASLGYTPMPDGKETLYLRSKVLVDVRSAGVPFPIGGGGMFRKDVDGYREFAVENKGLGYNGMHVAGTPELINVVNDVFTPTKEQIDEWLSLMPIVDAAERDGFTTFFVGDRLFDLAGAVRAREQLDLARRLGLID